MDAYKTPSANLEVNVGLPFQPIKGLLFGLLYAIGLMFLISSMVLLGFVLLLGLDLTDPKLFESDLNNRTSYLITDLIVSFVILFFAGRATGKYTPHKEIKYGVVLALLTCLIYVPLSFFGDEYSDYPIWYNALSVLSVFIAIYFGAKSRIKLSPR